MRLSRWLVLPFVIVVLAVRVEHVGAVLFGDEKDGPQWQAVVSLNGGACTATFIHPRFAITAAHCMRQCTSLTDVGCVTARPREIADGKGQRREGAVAGMIANTGLLAGQGPSFKFDFVFFPTAREMGGPNPPDVALLRSTTSFRGEVIPMLPSQDLPRPDESRYCPRFEFTWPTIVGFSPNSGIAPAARRAGRSFAECDLEREQTAFKLDAHGRTVRGARVCQGDSGGPVLWPTSFGGFAVGGINSFGDEQNPDDPFLNDRLCRNWGNPDDQLRGESGHAFVPAAFLDRVARTQPLCGGAGSWDRCKGGATAYGGYGLRCLSTRIEQCGGDILRVPGFPRGAADASVIRGEAGHTEISTSQFAWFCDEFDSPSRSPNWTTAPDNARFLILRRGITDRQVVFDFYQIRSRPPGVVVSPPPPPDRLCPPGQRCCERGEDNRCRSCVPNNRPCTNPS